MKFYQNPVMEMIGLDETDMIATSLNAIGYDAEDEESLVFDNMF